MPLTPEAFIAPKGRFTPDLFPGLTLETALEAWIEDAEAQSEDEAAQAAWVEYRALDAIVVRLNSEPAQQRDRDKSDAFTDSQLKHWTRERDKALARFRALTGTEHRIRALF